MIDAQQFDLGLQRLSGAGVKLESGSILRTHRRNRTTNGELQQRGGEPSKCQKANTEYLAWGQHLEGLDTIYLTKGEPPLS
jgi:hypothetical protein